MRVRFLHKVLIPTLVPALLVVLALALAGCGQAGQAEPAPDAEGEEEPPAETAPPESTDSGRSEEAPEVEPAITVTMLQGNYQPKEVRIKAGQAVKWWNNDTEVHGPLVIYLDGDFAKRVATNGGPFHPDQTWTYVFAEPGKYLLKDRAATLDVIMEQWVYVEP